MRGVLPIFIGRAMASLELQCLSRGVWPGWSLKIRSNDRSLLTFRDSFEPEEEEAVDVDGLDPKLSQCGSWSHTFIIF